MGISKGTVNTQTKIWDVNTMAFIDWDGSLTAGDLTIGTVDQGAPGAVAWPVALATGTNTVGRVNQGAALASQPWYVQLPTSGLNVTNVAATPGAFTVDGFLDFSLDLVGNVVYLQVSGTYATASFSFTTSDSFSVRGFEPVLGMRMDTGEVESITSPLTNVTRTWRLFVPSTDPDSFGGIFRLTCSGLTSGSVTVYATTTAPVQVPVVAANVFALPSHTTALEFDVNDNPLYIGLAKQGSAKSAAKWQIRKLTWDVSDNPTDIQYANGVTDFNQVWNDRASLSYS